MFAERMSSSASQTTTGNGRMEAPASTKGAEKRSKPSEAIAPIVTQDNDKFVTLQKLLPGIPDDVTLEHVITKLPWRTSYTLSSVSRAWRQASQGRLIYDARLRCDSAAETFLVINHIQSDDTNAIALYSLRDRACYYLPAIPQVESGIPWSCRCITLDGRIYILGGMKDSALKLGSKEVYVLDLAGQRQWKQCASMQDARARFGCGVLNGKIYVFGGTSLDTSVCGSEVYDPNGDAWLAIRPAKMLPFHTEVTTVGEELFVYHRAHYYPVNRRKRVSDRKSSSLSRAYHPVKNEWRMLSPGFDGLYHWRLFMANGKLHSLSALRIAVYDTRQDSWTRLHSFSFPSATVVWPLSVVSVGDELLATAGWTDYSPNTLSPKQHATCLVHSKALGGTDKNIVWEKAPCSLSFGNLRSPFMCPLRL